jgi:hypothetical protein
VSLGNAADPQEAARRDERHLESAGERLLRTWPHGPGNDRRPFAPGRHH